MKPSNILRLAYQTRERDIYASNKQSFKRGSKPLLLLLNRLGKIPFITSRVIDIYSAENLGK